jgi:hypothetical protein
MGLSLVSKSLNVAPAVLGIILLCAAQQSNRSGWRGIVPLHSTRADVEQLLGPGTNELMGSYYRDDFNAFFSYSTGDCERESSGGWDVPAGTVLSITVHQKPQPKFSDLGLDESRFKKSHSIGDLMNYVDEGQGLVLEVYQGNVQTFTYISTHADDNLRCPGSDDIFYASRVPKQARAPLLERLNEYIECSRSQQYEKQYMLYLPEFARERFMAKTAKQFVVFTGLLRGAGTPGETLIEFKPESIYMVPDTTYGEVCDIFGIAKTDDDGNIVESHRTTRLVLRDGQWYFVDLFRPIPL